MNVYKWLHKMFVHVRLQLEHERHSLYVHEIWRRQTHLKKRLNYTKLKTASMYSSL